MTASPLASMTGYARAAETSGGTAWAWDIKTVNGKALDIRCRVPPGLDAVEGQARVRIAARCRRGTIQATLSVQKPPSARMARVNRPVLETLLQAVGTLSLPPGLAPASLDGLLAVPGVVEVIEAPDPDEGDLSGAILATLDVALDGCIGMRAREGGLLGDLLKRRLDSIRRLIAAADAAPGRMPDAIRTKLARRVAELAGAVPALDAPRLHAEAVLLAAKADVREELNRLSMHAAAAADLLEDGGPVGRRLDFLAQELGREASTLCAKSNDGALTLIGLDLRTEIDQFREQVQNLE